MKLNLLKKLGFSINYVNTLFNWRQQNCAWDRAKSRTRWLVSKPPAAHAVAGGTRLWRRWSVLRSEAPAPPELCPDDQQRNCNVRSTSGKEESLDMLLFCHTSYSTYDV